MDTSNFTGQLSTLVALVRAGVMLISMVTFANSARAETFSAPGIWTYTVPSGVNALEVLVVGGGGGGGGNSNPAIAPGGAGGNGARITAIISVTPGQVLSGTIGAGGVTGFSADGTGGGGGGGTTFAVDGTVLLQAAGGGGGGGGGGASASAGITSTTLSSSSLCGTAATGFSSANLLPDGGGGGNCHNGSSAIQSMAISADGGAGASGVSALTTTAGPAGGSGYVHISTSAIAITTSSTTVQDLVSAANPKSVPGATMEHCFLMSNAWSTNVSGVTISVQIAPNQAYIDGSAKAGTTCDAATTAAGVTHNSGTLTLNAASISANASYALVYRSNIN